MSLLRLSPPLKVPSMSEVSLKVAFISHNMQIRQLLQEADDSLLYIRPDVGMRFGLLDYHKMASIVECGTVAAKAVLGRWEERQKKRLFRQLRRTARQYAHAHAAAAAAMYRGQRAVAAGRGGAGGVTGRILQNIGADTPTAVMVRAGSSGQLAAARGPLLPPAPAGTGAGFHGPSKLSGGGGRSTGTGSGSGGAGGPRVGTLLATINAPASATSSSSSTGSGAGGPVGGVALPGFPHASAGSSSGSYGISSSSGSGSGAGGGGGGVLRVPSGASSVTSGQLGVDDGPSDRDSYSVGGAAADRDRDRGFSTSGSPWQPGSPERAATGAQSQQQHGQRHGSVSVSDSPLSAHGRAAAALSAGLALHPQAAGAGGGAASTVSAAPGLAHLRIPGGASGSGTGSAGSHVSVTSAAGGSGIAGGTGTIALPARTSPFFIPGVAPASSGLNSTGSGGNSGAAGTALHSHLVHASAANGGAATPFLMAVDSSALAGIPPLAQLTPAVAAGSGALTGGPQALAASLAAGASLAAARREDDDEEGPPSI